MQHLNALIYLFFAISIVALSTATPAVAGLLVCNETGVKHSLSVAYKDGDTYVSEGWWNIPPYDCSQVISGDLKQRYYYFRATATDREFSGERYFFCTQTSAFTIVGDENCADRGYDKSEYRKLDTGKTAKEFTLALTEDDALPAQQQSSKDPFTLMRDDLFGEWYSKDDSLYHVLFAETRHSAIYDGDVLEKGIFDFGNTCTGAQGAGPVLLVWIDGEQDPSCYVIYTLDYLNLEMSYVGGNGSTLRFGKLD